MLTTDLVRANSNIGFYGKKISSKTAAKALTAVAAATGVSVGAKEKLQGDVFVKEAKQNTKNDFFEKNLKLVPANKKVVAYFEKKYGIHGETYEELKKRAVNKYKHLRIDKRENEDNYYRYKEYSEITRQDLEGFEGRCSEVSDYIDFLNAVAAREYTSEEAKILNSKIKNYKQIQSLKQKLIDKYQNDSIYFQELADEQDDLHCEIANYGYSADIYTWH